MSKPPPKGPPGGAPGPAHSVDAEHPAVRRVVGAAGGEIVERHFGHPDDVVAHEGGPLPRPVLGVLQRAFPFYHRPAVEILLRELREHRAEIDMAVAGRAEPPRPVHPGLVAAVDPLPPGRVQLGVLDMKHFYPLVVDVDVVEVIERLQHVVRGVVEHVGPRMPADPLEEHLERDPVMQVLAGVDLVADIHPMLLRMVEDRPPALRQLVERSLHQPRRPLRPGVDIGPRERARERRMGRYAEVPARRDRLFHLIDGPFLPGLRVAVHRRVGEPVEGHVICGVHGDELALQMGRKLGDLDAVLARDPLHLVTILLRRRGLLQIEEPPVPAWHLHTQVTAIGGPFRDAVERIEGRLIARELGQKQRRPLDGLHDILPCFPRYGRFSFKTISIRMTSWLAITSTPSHWARSTRPALRTRWPTFWLITTSTSPASIAARECAVSSWLTTTRSSRPLSVTACVTPRSPAPVQ